MRKKMFAALCLLAMTICFDSPKANTPITAISPCVVGRTSAAFGFWTWPAGTQVNIYLRGSDFSAADVAAVRVSVRNWDESAAENGSNVHFVVQGLTRETKTARGDLTIVRGEVYSKKRKHLAQLEAHSLQENQLIDYAVVRVDVSVRNPEVLTNVMAHELGHTLGLLDCYNCSGQSTAMGLMKTAERANGIEGPTACDKQAVVAGYRELLVRVRKVPVLSQVDEGEEPEADDTAVVDRP